LFNLEFVRQGVISTFNPQGFIKVHVLDIKVLECLTILKTTSLLKKIARNGLEDAFLFHKIFTKNTHSTGVSVSGSVGSSGFSATKTNISFPSMNSSIKAPENTTESSKF